jgi:hypothetical protein
MRADEERLRFSEQSQCLRALFTPSLAVGRFAEKEEKLCGIFGGDQRARKFK